MDIVPGLLQCPPRLTFLFSSTRDRVLCLSALCCVIPTASDCEQDLSMCLHLACMGRHVLKRRTVQMFPADQDLRLLEYFDPLCSKHSLQGCDV